MKVRVISITLMIFVCILIANITAKAVSNPQAEIISIEQSPEELKSIRVVWDVANIEGDDYFVELYNATIGRIDKFPSTVNEYTYQNLKTEALYRLSVRVCKKDECSPWGKVQEVIVNPYITSEVSQGANNVSNITNDGGGSFDDSYSEREIALEKNEIKGAITSAEQIVTGVDYLTMGEKIVVDKIEVANEKTFISENQPEIEPHQTTENPQFTRDIIESTRNNSKKTVSVLKDFKLVELVDGEPVLNEGDLQKINMKETETKVVAVEKIPSDVNSNMEWTSDNLEVATVQDGIIKAENEGKAVITVVAKNGTESEDVPKQNNPPKEILKKFEVTVNKLDAPKITDTTSSTFAVSLSYDVQYDLEGVEIYNETLNRSVRTSNIETYYWEGLRPGTQYSFKIRGYYKIGDREKYTQYTSNRIINTQALTPPVLAKIKYPKKTKAQLYYQVTEPITGVEIYNITLNKSRKTTNKSTYSWTKLKSNKNKKYSFKIRSYYIIDGITYYSDYSQVIKGAYIPATVNGKKNIERAKVSKVKENYVYTGKAIKPNPKVKLGSKTLKKNRDYTVKYKNNKKVGTATLNIVGKGSYVGTINKNFSIAKKGTVVLEEKKFNLYRQNVGSHKNDKYGHEVKSKLSDMTGSIASNGCGPTSVAIIMSGYGYKKDPGEVGRGMAREVIAAPEKEKTSPSRCKYMKLYLARHGFKTKCHSEDRKESSYSDTKRKIKTALENGHQIVMWVGTSDRGNSSKNRANYKFLTNSGYHFISILNINDKDQVYIGNPNGMSNGWQDLSKVVKARGYKFWMEVYK